MKKIGHVKINIYVMSLVAVLIALVIYFMMFKVFSTPYPQWLRGVRSLLVFPYTIVLILIHELIHMIVAYFYAPVKSVHLRIKILTWEVSVDKPLQRNHYVFYTFAPGFILSLSVEIKFFSALLFLIGFAGATGDAYLALGALKYPRNCYILDKGAELDVLVPDN